jgi:hypothetical protein
MLAMPKGAQNMIILAKSRKSAYMMAPMRGIAHRFTGSAVSDAVGLFHKGKRFQLVGVGVEDKAAEVSG